MTTTTTTTPSWWAAPVRDPVPPSSTAATTAPSAVVALSYLLSREVHASLAVRVIALDGVAHEVCCYARLCDAVGRPVFSLQQGTACGVELAHGITTFDTSLTFPTRISDLALGDTLEFTLVGPGNAAMGVALLPLFGSRTQLRLGKHELLVHMQPPAAGADPRGPDAQAFEDEEANRRRARALPWLDSLAEKALISRRMERRRLRSPSSLVLAVELVFAGDCAVLYEEDAEALSLTSTGVPDATHELNRSSPVEAKYDVLRRFQRRGAANDLNLRPNTSERLRITKALANEKPTEDDNDLLWKFRHSLVNEAKALIKVLHSVKWEDEYEVAQAVELLQKWVAVDVADALQLLSAHAELSHPAVRATALGALARSSDAVLCSYLLQLVQALRYDRDDARKGGRQSKPGPLCRLLVERSLSNMDMASAFHWYTAVELKLGVGENSVFPVARDALDQGLEAQGLIEAIKTQDRFVKDVMQCVRHANATRERLNERSRRLIEALDKVVVNNVPLPLRPSSKIMSLRTHDARILSSTTSPAVVDLIMRDGTSFRCMFKEGDDLRQDQLIIQLLELMDDMFREVGLELCMTRYRVLATGPREGIVGFIPDALALSKVLKDYGSIPAFLDRGASEHGGQQAVYDRFVRSSAGYAVATYVLGIGDRHTDNIMLRPGGELFHVDFGFAFGRDPKSLATPVRVSKEMVAAMGGRESDGFRSFRAHCCEAYKVLRGRHALLFSVMGLMSDALIPDLSVTQPYVQAMAGVRDRLQLALEDQDADQWLLAVIDQSVDALGPLLIDAIHNFVVGN